MEDRTTSALSDTLCYLLLSAEAGGRGNCPMGGNMLQLLAYTILSAIPTFYNGLYYFRAWKARELSRLVDPMG